MMQSPRYPGLVCLFIALQAALAQQHRVDPRNMYERVLAVVPWTGGVGPAATLANPKRPMYAPTPAQIQASAVSRTGILAFQCMPSDDGTVALCEFVARDKAAFSQILADPTVKSFLKGRDSASAAIGAFSKHSKNFDLNSFGVVVP